LKARAEEFFAGRVFRFERAAVKEREGHGRRARLAAG
jgi:hypothetical protein